MRKKKLPTPKYDSKREQNVLLEKISQDVKIVAEGHSGIVKRLDIIESDLTEVKSELGTVKIAVMENSADIKFLKEGQKNLETGQEEIRQKLDTVTQDHEGRLRKLEAVR